jgi:hypothetical protein
MPQNFPSTLFASFITLRNLSTRHDTPSTNLVICVAREQSLAVGAPSQANTLRLTRLFAHLHILRLELVNLALLFKVEDDNTAGSGSTKPVAIGRENKGVDLISSIERIEMLRFIQVPKHRGAILAAGSTERAVRRDGDGVDISSVTDVIGLDLA